METPMNRQTYLEKQAEFEKAIAIVAFDSSSKSKSH